MGEPRDHALNCFLGAILVILHTIADLHNLPPVLRREVLISSLVCKTNIQLAKRAQPDTRNFERGTY